MSRLEEAWSKIKKYASGVDDQLQGWHKRTQAGLEDQLMGRETPEAGEAYQSMMSAAGNAPMGILKRINWEKSETRLSDLQKYAEALKRQFEGQKKLTGMFPVEHGIRGGIDDSDKLVIRRNIGDEGSIVNRAPPSLNPASEKAAFDFHTHPEGASRLSSSAEPSRKDLQVWSQRQRGNRENIVAAPDDDFLWWTLPKGSSSRGIAGMPSREEMMAQILHRAKKGDWDVQTSIDPRIYGVRE